MKNSDSQIIKLIINNLNRIPVVEEISDQTLDEDTQGNTSVIASDADEEDLIYEIIGLDSSKVNCEIDGPDIILLPYENWNGQSFCEVKVTDGEAEVLRTFNIIVNPINDAPVLEEISDITVNENDLVAITLNAIDPDNENLIYYISDFRFAKTDENVFEWQTTYDDEGIYEIEARVTDGIETDIQTFKLAIEDLNEPPHIVAIPDIFLEEDSGFTLVENVLSATDNDGEITKFKIANENQNNVDCEVNGNDLGLTPAVNFNGEATCVIRTYDDYLAYDETTVKIIVNNVNDAPEIKSFSPNFDPILIKNEEYNFNIEWSDVDTSAENIVVRWYVDDVLEAIGTEFNFVGSEDAGEFFIKVVVKDNFGETDSKEWKLIVTDKPIADSFEGSTTDFEGMTDDELSSVNLVLEKINYGKIEFLQPIDLTSVGDLDNYAKILTGFVVMDSGKYPIFKNQEAKITLYNIDSEKTPAIYYTKGFESDFSKITQVCPSSICSNINYSNNKLSFIVSGFSSFLVGDTLTCSQQGGNICEESEVCLGSLLSSRDSDACCPVECVPAFNDIDTCKKINNQIEIEIKNPDKNDDFEVGEKIPVEIKIKNNLDDKVNLEVGAYLYDLKEDESIGDAEDKIKIDDGDSKTIELEIEIPEDIEDNKFVILVKVEDDESTCNQDSIEIKIERKDHYVIVKEITITPQLISLGDEMNIEVQIENLGSREEDAIVLIENSELGISQKSEEFEIEEFGEEDKERVDFIIKIPENATEKEYILTAKILYNDGDENSLDKTFGVVKRLDLSGLNKLGPINLETIFLNDKTPYNQGVVSEGIILSDDNGVIALGGDDGKKIISNVKVKPLSLRLIPWLIFGIIVLFILIIIVDLANKNNPTQ
ncbi:hypothetical protein J4474_03400 [Candidatus Pacearchaeota archaeon]|nr:hypothetical protein [Candidatus Pacearchaeota archaeon]